MERTISDEDKIRKAMEISARRNNNYYTNISTARVNVSNKKEYKMFKKMIIQILICLLIYLIFYLLNTTNYVFSNEVIKNTNNILNYDININNIIKTCQEYINSKMNSNQDTNNINNNIISTIEIKENIVEFTSKNNVMSSNVIENEEINKNEEKVKQEKSQMELDAEKVKQICKFEKPISGKVTSEYGEREITMKGMTADHKGIDIAANAGTSIKAAMEGTVIVAEENSEYGKFIKIENNDVMTVYAHCKKLKVKKGEKIKQGQTIALVGTTGNSTGPHLHFEIRLSNRYINPRYVINF